MRKKIKLILFSACIGCCSIIFNVNTVFAKQAQMGFFGGINEGTRLPKTTETLLIADGTAKKAGSVETPYKEIIFLSGRPTEFSGLLTVTTSGSVALDKDVGTYKVTFLVKPNANAVVENAPLINRSITFNVNYRKEGRQYVYDYTAAAWTETISVDGQSFVLDKAQSHFDVSILEEKMPAATYYKGDISQKSVYISEQAEGDVTNNIGVETSGTLYGYDSAWSNTETHRLDSRIYNNDWQMDYQVRPSVSVNKTLQYSDNEPNAISFSGNYREVMSNRSGLQYDIFVKPTLFHDVEPTGKATISTYNLFEQLTEPNLAYLKGNSAEADIKKLFAMGILDVEHKNFVPSQAITRAQFVTMLAKASKLPIDAADAKKSTKKATDTKDISFVFPDIQDNRPDYPYIMAAYKEGIAIGRSNGYFYGDFTISREEAVAILVRCLGLSNIGLDPTPITPFVDDSEISNWAKRDLYAALKLGIIAPDADGKLRPKENISKAEGSALINRLIEYMRSELETDYAELIVNFAN